MLEHQIFQVLIKVAQGVKFAIGTALSTYRSPHVGYQVASKAGGLERFLHAGVGQRDPRDPREMPDEAMYNLSDGCESGHAVDLSGLAERGDDAGPCDQVCEDDSKGSVAA